MQTAQKMKKVSRELNELREGRASFYDLAVEIVEEHPLQAAVVLLAAWKDKPSAGVEPNLRLESHTYSSPSLFSRSRFWQKPSAV